MNKLNRKQIASLDALKESPELESYFFSKVNGLEWLPELVKRGYFDENKNPPPLVNDNKTISIFGWPAIVYLQRAAKLVKESGDAVSAQIILEILRNVSRPPVDEPIDNNRTWALFAKVLIELPNDLIKIEDIDLLNVWLHTKYDSWLLGHDIAISLLPKFLNGDCSLDIEKAKKVFDIATQFTPDGGKDGRNTLINPYHLSALFEKNATQLGNKCGEVAVEILLQRIERILVDSDNDRFTYIWRRAIEDNEQNINRGDILEIFISGLRDVLLSFIEVDAIKAYQYIKYCLESQFQTLQRIAVYIVGKRYNEYSDLLWQWFSEDKLNVALQHELYSLFRDNYSKFKPEDKSNVIEIVTSLSEASEDEELTTRRNAYMQMTWLHAMKDQGDTFADKLYADRLAITGVEPEHPDFSTYSKAMWAGSRSPITAASLLANSISDIVQYLKDFKPSGNGWDEPTEDGLGAALAEAVKQEPNKFKAHLFEFNGTSVVYQHSLIKGFQDLWNSKKNIPWEELLDWMLWIISQNGFWVTNEEESPRFIRPTRSWLTSSISDLIKTGTHSDEWAFEAKYLPTAQKMLDIILQNERFTAQGGDDAMTESLNTPKGRAIDALISLSLRVCRVAQEATQEHESAWMTLQPLFDREIYQCTDGNIEFSTLCTSYLPNIQFLSEKWLRENINRLFPVEYERNWRSAMHGFAYVTSFNDSIYKLLNENGHLSLAFHKRVPGRHVMEKLLQYVGIAYLRELEELDSGLFSEILERWDHSDISALIGFFWMLRNEKENEKVNKRILAFWSYCYSKLKGKEDDNGEILIQLSHLAVFLNKIEAVEKEWLSQAIRGLKEGYNAVFLIEYLDRLADESPKAVGELYLELLRQCTPDYDPERIRSIIEKLYDNENAISEADSICNEYAKRPGSMADLVRKIYEKHRGLRH